jgi:hypothetical protein
MEPGPHTSEKNLSVYINLAVFYKEVKVHWPLGKKIKVKLSAIFAQNSFSM